MHILILPLLLLASCCIPISLEVDADLPPIEIPEEVLDAGPHKAPKDAGEPDAGLEPPPPLSDAALAWEARRKLLEGLPLMGEPLVEVAVELTNQELEANDYTLRVVPVPVRQGTLEELTLLAGEPACGWTPGKNIYILEGDVLCEYFEECPTKRIGWVLSHELLHTIGFGHDAEMKGLTDKLGRRWRDHCENEDDGGI